MKVFVKDCQIVQARVVVFGMQIDDNMLYHGIGNQLSAAYSSLYLSDFLSFYTSNMQVHNDVLYCGIEN